MIKNKEAESFVAVSSFIAAVALAFTALIISPEHDIAAGVLMMCAQFLLLTASIFGLDYKHSIHQIFTENIKGDETRNENTTGNKK